MLGYDILTFLTLFPILTIPYGIGKKPDHCNQTEYLQYLVDLVEPRFNRADFLLVIHSMYQRHQGFQSAILNGRFPCSVPRARSAVVPRATTPRVARLAEPGL